MNDKQNCNAGQTLAASGLLAALVDIKNKAEEKRKSPTTAVSAEYWEGRRDGMNDAISIINEMLAANDQKLSHADDDSRQPETLSANPKA